MRQLINLGNEPYQRHVILFEESEIVFELRFMSSIQQWYMNLEYKDWSIDAVKLSCGVLHIRSENQPFDFIVKDNFGLDTDPFRLNDFSDERCSIYLLESDDMDAIRGHSVEI